MKGIICLGDSITHGRGEQPNKGWAGRLKEDFENENEFHVFYNLGIPGDTTTNLLKRMPTELKYRAKYVWPGDWYKVIIAIGINDTRIFENKKNNETKKSDFKKNIKKIIQIAKKHTKQVYVIGITPVDEKITTPFENTYFYNKTIKEYNKVIKDVSKEEKVQFIEVYDEFKNYSKLLSDGVHPNKKGYELMYKIISKKVIN